MVAKKWSVLWDALLFSSRRNLAACSFLMQFSYYLFSLLIFNNIVTARKQVLRSYDNRVRITDRSSEVYLGCNNSEIVGGQVETVIEFLDIVGGAAPETDEAPSADSDDDDATNDWFWKDSKKKTIQIIATPYRPGQHFATSPKAFVPIIDQLQSLHENGFVHGDIRAFNTVFGKESNEQGCLIDFDFGGRKGERCYPKGYRGALEDGSRVGRDGEKILVWHDWYALGQLIFTIHRLKPPSGDGDGLLSYDSYEIIRFWSDLERAPTQEEIQELKTFLSLLEGKRWRVEPRLVFRRALAENAASG
jgi:hypothetical protein